MVYGKMHIAADASKTPHMHKGTQHHLSMITTRGIHITANLTAVMAAARGFTKG